MSVRVKPKSAVEEFLEEEKPVVEEEEEEEVEQDPIDIITEQFENSPDRETIERWKRDFGSVSAYAPDPETLFLIRPLRRIEHKRISADLRLLSEGEMARRDPSFVEDQLHEKVISTCLLFPAADQDLFTMSEAGLTPTLFALIMVNSKFVEPESAMRNTFRL